MVIDRGTHLDLLDLDDLLLLARLCSFLLLFVFEFPVIQQLDHRRTGFRGDLDQIEALLLSDRTSIIGTDLPEFMPVDPYQKNCACGYLLVHTWPVLGRSRGRCRKTSGDYDSLLL